MKKKKILLVVLIVIVIIGVIPIINFVQKYNARGTIENSLEINLPSKSKIEEFSYSVFDDSFYAKISIESKYESYIKEQLNGCFFQPAEEKFTGQINFDDCQWWDMDINNIDTSYNALVSFTKKSHKTRDVWAFITKEINGQYILYISY